MCECFTNLNPWLLRGDNGAVWYNTLPMKPIFFSPGCKNIYVIIDVDLLSNASTSLNYNTYDSQVIMQALKLGQINSEVTNYPLFRFLDQHNIVVLQYGIVVPVLCLRYRRTNILWVFQQWGLV